MLAALKGATVATWATAGAFDFDGLPAEAVALIVLDPSASQMRILVVTRASQGAFLAADLWGMLDALAQASQSQALAVFPGAALLFDALRAGIEAACRDLQAALRAPAPGGGPSMLEAFAQAPRGPRSPP